MLYRPDAIKEVPARVRSQEWEKKDAAKEVRPRERETRLSGRAAGGRFCGCGLGGGEGVAVSVIVVGDGVGTSCSCSSSKVVLPCVYSVVSACSSLSGECCAG